MISSPVLHKAKRPPVKARIMCFMMVKVLIFITVFKFISLVVCYSFDYLFIGFVFIFEFTGPYPQLRHSENEIKKPKKIVMAVLSIQ